METAERLHRRMETMTDLHTIVRTMRVLSAVNIRQYELAVRALSDYARTVELGLHVILREMDVPAESKPQHYSACNKAGIVFGSDHGLCGRFNEDIASYAFENMTNTTSATPGTNANVARVVAVGSRTAAALDRPGLCVTQKFPVPGSAVRITATVQLLLRMVDQWQASGECQEITLYYNSQRKNGGYQPTSIVLWPVNPHQFKSLETAPWPSRRLPVYTMNRNILLACLLQQYFFITLFRACAESQASEHASRLRSMQSAQKNLDEKRKDLAAQFRRVRQEAITTELLDVVSGFDSIVAHN